ncbi:thioesterase II family protein [Brevibacillus agri]|uniref:thioesterase II family protein n=1 Tax=Brevibacillus agri TaxID=51101 RepID=UPI003D19068F
MEKLNLFCLPYAGAASSIYLKWIKYLNPSINLIPIELAGRGKRLNEPFYTSVEHAVEDIYQRIESHIDETPFALFGHSMGSLLAYECSHKIFSCKKKLPKVLFLSGKNPPNKATINKTTTKMIHNLSDKEFVNALISFGGTPNEVTQNEDLLNILLPILRADFKIIETYKHKEKKDILECDFVVLNGKQDNLTTIEEMKKWSKYTKRRCEIYNFDGGHFFIVDEVKAVLDLINKRLSCIVNTM